MINYSLKMRFQLSLLACDTFTCSHDKEIFLSPLYHKNERWKSHKFFNVYILWFTNDVILWPITIDCYFLTLNREEDSLVEQFTFEILATFVQSLAMAHHDAKSLGKHL